MPSVKYLVTFVDGTADDKMPSSLMELFTSEGAAWSKVYQEGVSPKRVGVFPARGVTEAAKLITEPAPAPVTRIPQGDKARKDAPMYRGLLGYFPAALFEVAAHSMESDRKHNGETPDAPHWARGKSADHEDCIVRHLIDAGKLGSRGRRYHLRALAWRALALLQEECEAEGSAPGVSAVFP